jgi:hypothetical protein
MVTSVPDALGKKDVSHVEAIILPSVRSVEKGQKKKI